MKRIKIISGLLFSLITLLLLALLSCGGGGSESAVETNTTLTADNAPQAAAGVLKAMDIANALQGVTSLITTSSASSTTVSATSPINNILNMTASAMQSGQQTAGSYIAGGSIPYPFSVSVKDYCDSGTISITNASWDAPDDLNEDNFKDKINEIYNFKGQVTFSNCVKSSLKLNGTVTISAAEYLTSPTAATVSGSLTYYDSSNSTTLALSSATVAVSNIGTDFDMSNATILASGTLQGTIDSENISIRCKNLSVQLASISGGMTATLSGQVRSACLETWLTITTATPVTLMSGDSCPTGGDVSASYDGNTVRVEISDDYSMVLYFNGEEVDTYDSCTDLKGECP